MTRVFVAIIVAIVVGAAALPLGSAGIGWLICAVAGLGVAMTARTVRGRFQPPPSPSRSSWPARSLSSAHWCSNVAQLSFRRKPESSFSGVGAATTDWIPCGPWSAPVGMTAGVAAGAFSSGGRSARWMSRPGAMTVSQRQAFSIWRTLPGQSSDCRWATTSGRARLAVVFVARADFLAVVAVALAPAAARFAVVAAPVAAVDAVVRTDFARLRVTLEPVGECLGFDEPVMRATRS